MRAVVISAVHTDTFGQIVGVCNGRKVQWTYSVEMWFFVDTGAYIFGKVRIAQ